MATRRSTGDAALLRAAAAWAKRYAPQQASQGQQEAPRVISRPPLRSDGEPPRYIPLLLTEAMLRPPPGRTCDPVRGPDARAVDALAVDIDDLADFDDLADLPAKYRLVPEPGKAIVSLVVIGVIVILVCHAYGLL